VSFLAPAGQLRNEFLDRVVVLVWRCDPAALDQLRDRVPDACSFVFVSAIVRVSAEVEVNDPYPGFPDQIANRSADGGSSSCQRRR
jgi:hypothetical protein